MADAIGTSCHIDAGVLLDGVLDCHFPELDELLSYLVEIWNIVGAGKKFIC
jgi:hypothetical protein